MNKRQLMSFILTAFALIAMVGMFKYEGYKMLSRTFLLGICLLGLTIINAGKDDSNDD